MRYFTDKQSWGPPIKTKVLGRDLTVFVHVALRWRPSFHQMIPKINQLKIWSKMGNFKLSFWSKIIYSMFYANILCVLLINAQQPVSKKIISKSSKIQVRHFAWCAHTLQNNIFKNNLCLKTANYLVLLKGERLVAFPKCTFDKYSIYIIKWGGSGALSARGIIIVS